MLSSRFMLFGEEGSRYPASRFAEVNVVVLARALVT